MKTAAKKENKQSLARFILLAILLAGIFTIGFLSPAAASLSENRTGLFLSSGAGFAGVEHNLNAELNRVYKTFSYDFVPGSLDASKSTVKFGQSSVKSTFAHGPFKGQSIADVAKGLRSGKISPDQLPVEYIVRNGEKVALNNRSLTTLQRAGMDPTKLIDRTGIARYEKLLDSHLAGGSASDVIRIRGGAPGTSLIE